MDSYYTIQTRKGLMAEALVVDTLETFDTLKSGWTSADYEQQTRQDIDLLGVVKLPSIQSMGVLEVSIKYQEAGKSYGAGGEFGFELYEVRASDNQREYKPFLTADDYKVLTVLQGGKVYVFTVGMVRRYLKSNNGGEHNFTKTRGLTAKLRQQLADCNYRYSNTISGYIDVEDFVASQPVVVLEVEPAKLEVMELLAEVNLSVDALRDTHYALSLLRFVTTLTKGKTKGTKRAMLSLVEQITSLYA